MLIVHNLRLKSELSLEVWCRWPRWEAHDRLFHYEPSKNVHEVCSITHTGSPINWNTHATQSPLCRLPWGHSPGLFEDQKSEGKTACLQVWGNWKFPWSIVLGWWRKFLYVREIICEKKGGGPVCVCECVLLNNLGINMSNVLVIVSIHLCIS